MKNKSHSQSAFFNLHVLIALVVVFAGSSIAFHATANQSVPTQGFNKTLTFAERVAYQTAIEDVYWRHRIWPKENPNPKPSLDAVMSQAQLENKVAAYLRDSVALEHYGQPITAAQLQAEMDRMARDTKQPGVLRELFDALGNDSAVIAECLVRPALAERLIADLSAQDQTRRVESPQADGPHPISVATTLGPVVYTLPTIADTGESSCTDDTWTATSFVNAFARDQHTAVWTGSEMIVWGGYNGSYLNTGGRYNPATDTWTPTSATNAPAARANHTAVWTGNEMIVWGGGYLGGRYNPATDKWTATSATNAPAAQAYHTAVWTGSEMIVWGGVYWDGYGDYYYLNTGGRYNPATDTWTATSTTNGPSERANHTAVWTGNEMIVWGGEYPTSGYPPFNTGGRYNPATDSWMVTTTTNAPSGRSQHTAVWTGSEMIVWGGAGNSGYLNTGGRYNAATDSWTATSTNNVPDARYQHTAVWTGSEMIVWGGTPDSVNYFNTGGRYCAPTSPPTVTTNPATNVPSSSATLNGSVNPNGLATTVYFEYGTTTSYGHNTANHSYNGDPTQNVSANISGLSPSTTYHFRIVAHSSSGTSYGSDRSFTTLSPTGPPVVTTNAATLIASYSATLNGAVDPHGLTTTVYFQYGTTTSYGHNTAAQTKTGSTPQSFSANINGLTASTTYHFRIVTANSAGTRYGSDKTFTTVPPTGFPMVTINPATNVTATVATLHGSLDPHGLNTSVYFQYGRTTIYGSRTPNETKTGNSYQNVSATISGLSGQTTYHFRIVATNSVGTRYGNDRTFITQ